MPSEITVVIADDNPVNRMQVERALARVADITLIASCEDGSTALDAIREHRPDVALLDQYMPGLDGLDVARTAKDEGIDVAVAIISAGLDGVAMPDVAAAGVTELMEKGALSPLQLTQRIRTLAEARRADRRTA